MDIVGLLIVRAFYAEIETLEYLPIVDSQDGRLYTVLKRRHMIKVCLTE